MEVTAAAAQAATYTNSKSLAEQINDYLAATKTSIATLASEIPGYSRPTISRYLSGKYLTLSGELIKDAAPEDKAGAAAQ